MTHRALARRWAEDLPPAASFFVMATGIVSTAIHLLRHPVVSLTLLAMAAVADDPPGRPP